MSAVLHLLLHLAEQKEPVTSGVLAKSLGTNPVVIRRILAGLRTHGYVASDKGHGGGWMLACRPDAITLRDIYVALGCPSILALDHWSKSPGCLVEQAVNDALNVAFQDASLLLLERLGEVTLATLHAGLRRRTTRHHSAKAQS